MRNTSIGILFLLATRAAHAEPTAPGPPPALWTPPGIVSAAYESSPSFPDDGSEMYFFRADARFSNYHLLFSRCEAGGWSAPRPPSFAQSGVLETDPYITPDSKTLYFVADRHRGSKPGNEDLDIYRVERKTGGAWGEPQRLPEPVNSPAAELLPRLDSQGRIWFGSSREGGLGQGDLYIATFVAGKWTVKNAGPPLSSRHYEYEIEISRDGNTAVTVANRGERSHLYLFRREAAGWREIGRIPARDEVFQVGPLLSPAGDRLLFAQAVGELSGELFLFDLAPGPDKTWPPACGR